MGSHVCYKRRETIWWWSYLVGSSWWTKVFSISYELTRNSRTEIGRSRNNFEKSWTEPGPKQFWKFRVDDDGPWTSGADNDLNITFIFSIPCAAPSTPSKSLVGYKRARNSREKEVEDRTYPHLDHVDNPRQTTHAVGVLKAVKIGRHFSGWVFIIFAFYYEQEFTDQYLVVHWSLEWAKFEQDENRSPENSSFFISGLTFEKL